MGGSAYERMVLQVTKVLCHIWGSGLNSQFHVIDFQDPIKELRAHVPQKYWQVSLKRQMYKAAEAIATERKAHALVTGEAIGQVSSQTLSNLHTIDRACQMPVLRPLIAFDKTDIIALAYHIGTATLSERIPEHCSITTTSPAVRSTLQDLEDGEAPMDASVLEHAVRTRKILDLNDITANDLRAPYLFVEQLQADHQLIDCQPDAFYKKWHIAGIPHHSPDDLPTLKKQLSKKVPYVLFCNHGVQSALMAESLQQSGFDAYAFRGGLLELNSQYEALIEAQLAAEGL
jgi:thiamine biosynthesis protein ThiI